MSYPNVPRTGLLRVGRATFAEWGVAYKVALGVAAVGIFIMVWHQLAGGFIYTRALAPLIEILVSPAEGTLSTEPEVGANILLMVGVSNLVAGVCMFCVRLILELLGLAGAPALTRRMRPNGKLAVGTAAAGLTVLVPGIILSGIISELFTDYESTFLEGALRALDVMSQAGGLVLLCAAITLFIPGRGRLRSLLGWTRTIGWAVINWGWINKFAVALIVAGIVMRWSFMPFDDVADPFAFIGVTLLVLGIIPQLTGRRP